MEGYNFAIFFLISVSIVNICDACKSHQEPSVPTPAPPTYTSSEGILVAGGFGVNADEVNSVEVFVPGKRKSCKLPELPYPRSSLTVDIVDNTPVVCGGAFDINNDTTLHTLETCLQLQNEEWTEFAKLKSPRFGHTSWVSPAGLMLLGGYYGNTAELVNPGADPVTFNQTDWRACAIDDTDSVIITGDYMAVDEDEKDDESNKYSFSTEHYYGSKKVTRYNLQGFVENLPRMKQGRWKHGCGAYQIGKSKVLLVAGGDSGNTIKSHYHTSTEKLVIGATSWTKVSPLPTRLAWVASVSLDNTVFITGGEYGGKYYSDVYAFDVDQEKWRRVGKLQGPRAAHDATKVDMKTIETICKWI